jgi:hypothetical protein
VRYPDWRLRSWRYRSSHQIDEGVSMDEIKLAARLYGVAAARYLGVEGEYHV